MRLNNLSIGLRLTLSFAFLLVLAVIANTVAIVQFGYVSSINTRIIEKEWVKADAANTINATTRAQVIYRY